MSTTPIGSPLRDVSSSGEMPIAQHKDEDRKSATNPPTPSPDASSFLDDNSDGELSEDPAPYADRELINKELISKESFEPHDTDPTKIVATFKMQMPNGKGWFTQKDVIPEKRDSTEEDVYGAKDSIFFPDLESCKVPKKDKEKRNDMVVRWNKVKENRWERTFKDKHEVFIPTIALRRFNARTHEYEHIHIGLSKLEDIDPNNKKWKDAYNKWIDQISRRSNAAYQKKKSRDHWTIPEICAMYTGINDFIHKNGIDAYDTMTTADLTTIVDAVNVIGGKNRGLDALRGQITSAHETKNKTMAYLRENSRDFRLLIEGGGIVSDGERYPERIIPLSEFPVEKRSHHRKGTGKPKPYKRKFRSVGTQTGEDTVVHEDTDDDTSTKLSACSPSRKRKRDAPASDSDEGETELLDEQSEEEEAEDGYGSDAGESSDDGKKNGDEPKAVEADVLPPSKKPRLTDHALELARRLVEDDSD